MKFALFSRGLEEQCNYLNQGVIKYFIKFTTNLYHWQNLIKCICKHNL